MKWSSERKADGRFDIKDEDGKVVFTSSLPDRGESDDVVGNRANIVVCAVNEFLARIEVTEPEAVLDGAEVADREDAALDAPKTKRGGKKS